MDEDLRPGARIDDRYELEKPLGKGGLATVWRALDLDAGSVVALKLLHSKFRVNPRARSALQRETFALGVLEHPGIAKCIDYRLDSETPWVAMELVNGVTLREEIARRAATNRPFSPAEAVSLLSDLAAAVDHAHERGIIHRDLKPANVMLTEDADRRVKVLDFGVAKILEASPGDATTQGNTFGTLMFMSPEQASGAKIGRETDVFSLGVILFEALTLRRPWTLTDTGELARAYVGPLKLTGLNTPPAVLRRIHVEERPAMVGLVPGLARNIERIVHRALAIRAEDRYSSASAFSEAFARAVLRPPIEPEATISWAESGPTMQDGIHDREVTLTDSDDPSPKRNTKLVAPVLQSNIPPLDLSNQTTTLDANEEALSTTAPDDVLASRSGPFVPDPAMRTGGRFDPVDRAEQREHERLRAPLAPPDARVRVAEVEGEVRAKDRPQPGFGDDSITVIPPSTDKKISQLRVLVGVLVGMNFFLILLLILTWWLIGRR